MARSSIWPRLLCAAALVPSVYGHRSAVDLTENATMQSFVTVGGVNPSGTEEDDVRAAIFGKLSQSMAQCRAKLDIVFVLDGSGSISEPDWLTVKEFVKSVAQNFEMGASDAAIGVVQFSMDARVECELMTEAKAFEACVDNIAQMKSVTYASQGFQYARDLLEQSERAGHLQGRVVFYIGDGLTDTKDVTPSINEARVLTNLVEGTTVVSIAVGRDPELVLLKKFASNENDFYHVQNPAALNGITGRMLLATCDYDDGADFGNNQLKTIYQDFDDILKHWNVVDTMAKRLLLEDRTRILRQFQGGAQTVIEAHASQQTSSSAEEAKLTAMLIGNIPEFTFARELGSFLQMAANGVDVLKAMELKREVMDFFELNLEKQADRYGPQSAEVRKVRSSLANAMKRFKKRVQVMSAACSLFELVPELWTEWQTALGPVRVYIKVGTQCRAADADGNPLSKADLSFEHQPEWVTCGAGSKSFQSPDFPSAIMTCARKDDSVAGKLETDNDMGDFIMDRDRMVRYLGCGGNRLQANFVFSGDPAIGGGSNPPIGTSDEPRLTQGCAQGDAGSRDWMTEMCPPGSGDSGAGCRLFGPFWAVYGAKMESVYGVPPIDPVAGARYPGRMECHQSYSLDQKCGDAQLEGFKGMLNDAPAEYVYGSLPPLYNSKTRKVASEDQTTEVYWNKHQSWPLQRERAMDPPLMEVLQEVEKGNSVVMLAYGFSGAGKTTTLIGDSTAPFGGLHGIDGVLTLYLKDMKQHIQGVRATFFELYGRMNGQDGSIKPGQGVWAYQVKRGAKGPIVHTVHLGSEDQFNQGGEHESDAFSFETLQARLQEYSVPLDSILSRDNENQYDWGLGVKQVLQLIETARTDVTSFEGTPEPIAHIRATPNNPKSSRGTLFTLLEIKFNNGETGYVSVLDLAGAEDPVSMVEGYLKFRKQKSNPVCFPGNEEVWQPSGPNRSGRKMIVQHLGKMADIDHMNGALADCVKLKVMLQDCKPGSRGCKRLVNLQGEEKHMKPDPLADESYITKDEQPDMPDFEFVVRKHQETGGEEETRLRFPQSTILKAFEDGEIGNLEPIKRRHNKGKSCARKKGIMRPTGCTWPERLWAMMHVLCEGDEDGIEKPCTGGERTLDDVVLAKSGKRISGASYVSDQPKERVKYHPRRKEVRFEQLKDTERDLLIKRLIGHVKVVETTFGMSRMKPFAKCSNKRCSTWMNVRKRFWLELSEWVQERQQRIQEFRDQWTLHMQYFTGLVGPMVEEAFFINEALNQLRGYLGLWAFKAEKKKGGEQLALFPPDAEFFGQCQVIDANDPKFISRGYNKEKCVQPAGAGESYTEQLAKGEDKIMVVGFLEMLRRLAKGKDTKILLGSFLRTDIPGADQDCSGALQSLEFAQSVQDALPGQSREEALSHLRGR
eukprot:TRINITY_DN14881_c0_g1_i3.p1 TRINITY_DN14881_c0_g1~~TRINITY_DN14881_c0_g1_i3.p1  ORF type:complete len:1452 (+),score=373.81 TRINITY_DN14881_c0_g1_i3:134-4357(+)